MCQFTIHLVETRNRVRYIASHLELFTYDLINCESWEDKLEAKFMSGIQGIPSKKILTPVAAVKASLHDPFFSFDLAHSRNSGVIGWET